MTARIFAIIGAVLIAVIGFVSVRQYSLCMVDLAHWKFRDDSIVGYYGKKKP